MSAIPEWKKPPVDVPVQDLREFIAKYGHDVTVLVTWTQETCSYQFVTIGSNRCFADSAVNLRDILANALQLIKEGPVKEDLRGDHPNIALTQPQIDFLLWAFGRLFAEKDKLPPGSSHADYISKYHDQILPLLIGAKTTLERNPA